MIFLRRAAVRDMTKSFIQSILSGKEDPYWTWSGSCWTRRQLDDDGLMFFVPSLLRDLDVIRFLERVSVAQAPQPGTHIVILWFPRGMGWITMAPLRMTSIPAGRSRIPPYVSEDTLTALAVLTS